LPKPYKKLSRKVVKRFANAKMRFTFAASKVHLHLVEKNICRLQIKIIL
jgi:hypothetical protein